MMRLFLDASVLFAAALSPTGASREILLLALQGRCRVVLSSVVIEERYADRVFLATSRRQTAVSRRRSVDRLPGVSFLDRRHPFWFVRTSV